jgi:hypothetical protein
VLFGCVATLGVLVIFMIIVGEWQNWRH